MIASLPEGAMLLADKGYDANALRAAVTERKAWANIATRYDKLAETTLPPSNSSLSVSGYAIMSLRPRGS